MMGSNAQGEHARDEGSVEQASRRLHDAIVGDGRTPLPFSYDSELDNLIPNLSQINGRAFLTTVTEALNELPAERRASLGWYESLVRAVCGNSSADGTAAT